MFFDPTANGDLMVPFPGQWHIVIVALNYCNLADERVLTLWSLITTTVLLCSFPCSEVKCRLMWHLSWVSGLWTWRCYQPQIHLCRVSCLWMPQRQNEDHWSSWISATWQIKKTEQIIESETASIMSQLRKKHFLFSKSVQTIPSK